MESLQMKIANIIHGRISNELTSQHNYHTKLIEVINRSISCRKKILRSINRSKNILILLAYSSTKKSVLINQIFPLYEVGQVNNFNSHSKAWYNFHIYFLFLKLAIFEVGQVNDLNSSSKVWYNFQNLRSLIQHICGYKKLSKNRFFIAL